MTGTAPGPRWPDRKSQIVKRRRRIREEIVISTLREWHWRSPSGSLLEQRIGNCGIDSLQLFEAFHQLGQELGYGGMPVDRTSLIKNLAEGFALRAEGLESRLLRSKDLYPLPSAVRIHPISLEKLKDRKLICINQPEVLDFIMDILRDMFINRFKKPPETPNGRLAPMNLPEMDSYLGNILPEFAPMEYFVTFLMGWLNLSWREIDPNMGDSWDHFLYFTPENLAQAIFTRRQREITAVINFLHRSSNTGIFPYEVEMDSSPYPTAHFYLLTSIPAQQAPELLTKALSRVPPAFITGNLFPQTQTRLLQVEVARLEDRLLNVPNGLLDFSWITNDTPLRLFVPTLDKTGQQLHPGTVLL